MRAYPLILLSLTLTGCIPTASQMRIYESNRGLREASVAYEACADKVAANPAYAELAPHMQLAAYVHATEVQQTDPTIPTASDRALLVAWSHDEAECRKAFTIAVSDAAPYGLDALAQEETGLIDVYQRWIQGTMSWGDGNVQWNLALSTGGQSMANARQQWLDGQNQIVWIEPPDRRSAYFSNSDLARMSATTVRREKAEPSHDDGRHRDDSVHHDTHRSAGHPEAPHPAAKTPSPAASHAAPRKEDHCGKAHPC